MFILLPIAAYAAFFAYLRGIGAISVFDYPSGAAADREQALLSDPNQYAALAENLLAHNVYSVSERSPFELHTFRTPGYPVYVAGMLASFRSYTAVIFSQIILAALTAFLILRIGECLGFRRAGFWAAIGYLIYPGTILNSFFILSDVLFAFLIVTGCYALLSAARGASTRSTVRLLCAYAGIGLIFGVAALVRPIGVYMATVLVPYAAWSAVRHDTTRKFVTAMSIALLAGCIILPAVWTARNYAKAGEAVFSPTGPYNLLTVFVSRLESYRTGEPEDRTRDWLAAEAGATTEAELQDAAMAPELSRIAMSYIRQDPFGYAKLHAMGVAKFFLTGSVDLFVYSVPRLKAVFVRWQLLPEGGFASLSASLFRGDLKELARTVQSQSIVVAERLGWVIVLALALWACIAPFAKPIRRELWLFAALVAYFAVLTGPIANARFRLPALPFLFLLAVIGCSILWDKHASSPGAVAVEIKNTPAHSAEA